MDIIAFLKKGQENAITQKNLARVFKVSEREIRQIISDARAKGAVILSTTDNAGGYYLPSTKEEVQQFVNAMTKRGRSAFRAIRSARILLKGWTDEERKE